MRQLCVAFAAAAAMLGLQPASRFVLAEVTDASGEPLAGLGADDFIVYEGAEARETIAATPAAYPVAVLVDTTHAARAEFIRIRAAVAQFVDRLSGRDVAVYSFGDRAFRVVDFTRDAARLRQAIEKLFARPDAESHVLDAIIEAAADIRRRESPVTLIAVVSAGGNDQSSRTPREVFEAVLPTHSMVHVIEMRTPRASGRLNNVRGRRSSTGDRAAEASLSLEDLLRALAERTHGDYKLVYSASGYETNLDSLRRMLAAQMIVEYASIAPDGVAPLRMGTRITGAVIRGVGLERAPQVR